MEIVLLLNNELDKMNATLVSETLNLFLKNNISDSAVIYKVSELLNNENRFIATSAFRYLSIVKTGNRKVLKKMKRFEKRRSETGHVYQNVHLQNISCYI